LSIVELRIWFLKQPERDILKDKYNEVEFGKFSALSLAVELLYGVNCFNACRLF